jgi:hypothetical protein
MRIMAIIGQLVNILMERTTSRYFFEDYENFVKESKFSKSIFRGLFEVDSNEYSTALIKEVRQRFSGTGYQNFSNSGIMVFLGK